MTESNHDRADRLEAEALVKDERIAGLIRDVENLNAKAEHREIIDQAKGIIMSTAQCGPDAAFAALVAQSQLENRKLWEIANELAGKQDHTEESN